MIPGQLQKGGHREINIFGDSQMEGKSYIFCIQPYLKPVGSTLHIFTEKTYS